MYETWFCEQCKIIQTLRYKKIYADVQSVMDKIGIDHREVNPGCQAGIFTLRVVNNDCITDPKKYREIIRNGFRKGKTFKELEPELNKLIKKTLATAETTKETDDAIAKIIHYPKCWDTTAYPTLAYALWGMVPFKSGAICSTCNKPQKIE